jgi:hypothetical protein
VALPQLDRITFFGLAIAARVKVKPGAWFNSAISGKWESFVTGPILDQARAAVKRVLYG